MKNRALPKFLLVPFFFGIILIFMCTAASAAEEFTVKELELSSSSSKDIEFIVKADAQTAFWSVSFAVDFDSDIFTFTGLEANAGLSSGYTVSEGKLTVLMYRQKASNITLIQGDTLVKLKFRVSDKIQPGEYYLSFSYPKHSMVTYSGSVKNLHINGGTLLYGNKVTYISGGRELSSDFSSTGDTVYPSPTCEGANADEIFIGWYAKQTAYHKKMFLAPGESFVIGNHDVTLEAVFLEIKTLPGASVYFAQEDNDVRLRYVSAVNKKQYDFLYETVLGRDSASAILGTLICPTAYAKNNSDIDNNGGMNFDALKNDRLAVQTSVPKAPGVWLSGSELHNVGASSEYYYYEGILNNIIRKNLRDTEEVIDYNTDFSAVAYLTVTYPSGKTVDHFAKYDPDSHSRSVSYVVTKALEDVSSVKTDYYRFKIDDVYRPYSSTQVESLYKIKANIG